MTTAAAARARARSAPELNRLRPEDRAVHDWYRFVLSFPSHLVRDYLATFGVDATQRVLDPFCGTGTTLVECKKLGIPSVGIERNPMAGFASRAKADWSVDPEALVSHAGEVARRALEGLRSEGIDDLGVARVYKADADDALVAEHEGIQRIARRIEQRRIEQGKTSGFERQYARVTKLYFGGMVRHLSGLRSRLRPGARLAYVVGDQASYLRVMIRTGRILGELAQSLGYELTAIDLFRTRLATASRQQLREEVVRLRWPG